MSDEDVKRTLARKLVAADDILSDCIIEHGDKATGARLRELLGVEQEALSLDEEILVCVARLKFLVESLCNATKEEKGPGGV